METDILKLIADYVLAGFFALLYVKSQAKLADVYKEYQLALENAYKVIAEQRREDNREMRQLLFELADTKYVSLDRTSSRANLGLLGAS